jgi:hypothetical protein
LKPYMYNNYCYAQCPTGMYPGAVNICTLCSLTCLTCVSSYHCTICKEGYAILADTNNTNVSCISVSTCPSYTILTIAQSTGIPSCLPCTSPCLNCQIHVTYCTSCINSYYLHNNTCVSFCPTPYHPIVGKCLNCTLNCITCDPLDPYSCT